MAKKILTLLLILGLILSASLVPAFADGEITITSPLNGSTVKAGTVTLSAAAEGAETVEFYLDGELVKSFAAGENASFDADVKGGTREFKALATFGGVSREAVSVFSATETYALPINDGASTEVQTFDSMGEEYKDRTLDQTLISNFSRDFGWTLTGENVYLQRTEGASGAEGDYAVSVIPYGNGGNANARLKLNGWTEKVTNGKIILDYDWKLSAPAQNGTNPRMFGLPVAAGGDIITENGNTIYDTGYAMADSTWTHMRYEYDVDNSTCSLWINGTQYWDNKAAEGESSDNDLSKLVFAPMFWSAASYYTKNYWAYFSLDNFSIKTESSTEAKEEASVFGNEKINSPGKIVENANNLSIRFASAFENYADGMVKISVNGGEESVAAAVYDSAFEIDLPSTLKVGDEVKITFDKSLEIAGEAIGKDIVLNYSVVKNENTTEVSVSDCKLNEGVFTCNINTVNLTGSADEMLVIIASYNGDRIANCEVSSSLRINEGRERFNKSLNCEKECDMIKVFVWNNLSDINPLTSVTEYAVVQ